MQEGVLDLTGLLCENDGQPRRGSSICPTAVAAPGKPADLIVFSDRAEWTVDKNAFLSKGKNTPFHGVTLKGRNLVTIVGGKIVYNGL